MPYYLQTWDDKAAYKLDDEWNPDSEIDIWCYIPYEIADPMHDLSDVQVLDEDDVNYGAVGDKYDFALALWKKKLGFHKPSRKLMKIIDSADLDEWYCADDTHTSYSGGYFIMVQEGRTADGERIVINYAVPQFVYSRNEYDDVMEFVTSVEITYEGSD